MQIESCFSHKSGRKLSNAWRYIFTVNTHSRLVSNQLPNQGSLEGCRHCFWRWRERLSCHSDYRRYEISECRAGKMQGEFLPKYFLLHSRLPPFSQGTLYTTCLFLLQFFFSFFSFSHFHEIKLTSSNTMPHRSQHWYFQMLFIGSIQLNKGKRKMKKPLWHILNAIILFCTAPNWSFYGDIRPQKDSLRKYFIFQLIKISSSLKLRHTWIFTMRTLCKTACCKESSLKHISSNSQVVSADLTNASSQTQSSFWCIYLQALVCLEVAIDPLQLVQDGVQPGSAGCTQCQRSYSGQGHRMRTAFWLTAIALTLPKKSFHEAVSLSEPTWRLDSLYHLLGSGLICFLFLCHT